MLHVNQIYNIDCLEGMKYIDDKSIDMILCDLPYGTTNCKWNVVIPFEKRRSAFYKSPEYKYYLLGVAQGLYVIYKAMSASFAKNVCTDDWMQFIKKLAADDKKVEEYFTRLINADNKNWGLILC